MAPPTMVLLSDSANNAHQLTQYSVQSDLTYMVENAMICRAW